MKMLKAGDKLKGHFSNGNADMIWKIEKVETDPVYKMKCTYRMYTDTELTSITTRKSGSELAKLGFKPYRGKKESTLVHNYSRPAPPVPHTPARMSNQTNFRRPKRLPDDEF